MQAYQLYKDQGDRYFNLMIAGYKTLIGCAQMSYLCAGMNGF